MARRRPNSSSSIYISTDPQNNVPIGVAGEGVAIGRLGVLIYKDTGGAAQAPQFEVIGGSIAFTPETVPVALEFA